MKTYKRRHYYIDRDYQGRAVAMILLICSLGMLLELAVFNFLASGTIEALRWSVHIDEESLDGIIRSYLVSSGTIAVTLTVVTLFLFLRNLFGRTAGPIYRLKKDIDVACSGDLSLSVWLRREDDFKETAKELNTMIGALRSDFKIVKERFVEVTRAVDLLGYIDDKPDLSIRKCREIMEVLESIRDIKKQGGRRA